MLSLKQSLKHKNAIDGSTSIAYILKHVIFYITNVICSDFKFGKIFKLFLIIEKKNTTTR